MIPNIWSFVHLVRLLFERIFFMYTLLMQSMQHSDDPDTDGVGHERDNINNSPDARFQGQELYKCCAMKLVAKEVSIMLIYH